MTQEEINESMATSETVSQPSSPVADNQETAPVAQPTTPVVEQSTTPQATDSNAVKLSLTVDESNMIKDLLNNYTYAYRSDSQVDCEREIVEKEKAGKWPYPATAPGPEITNPVYDWANSQWIDKSQNVASTVAQLKSDMKKAQAVQDHGVEQTQLLGMQFNQFGQQMTSALEQLTGSINEINQKLDGKTTAKPVAQPTEPVQPTTLTEPNATTEPETKQGGNE